MNFVLSFNPHLRPAAGYATGTEPYATRSACPAAATGQRNASDCPRHKDPDRLFVSRDPVAADTLSLEAVNGQRKPPLDQVTDQVAYLRRAASFGLGANDPDEIEKETLDVS